jgi:hypothetical protein
LAYEIVNRCRKELLGLKTNASGLLPERIGFHIIKLQGHCCHVFSPMLTDFVSHRRVSCNPFFQHTTCAFSLKMTALARSFCSGARLCSVPQIYDAIWMRLFSFPKVSNNFIKIMVVLFCIGITIAPDL